MYDFTENFTTFKCLTDDLCRALLVHILRSHVIVHLRLTSCFDSTNMDDDIYLGANIEKGQDSDPFSVLRVPSKIGKIE